MGSAASADVRRVARAIAALPIIRYRNKEGRDAPLLPGGGEGEGGEGDGVEYGDNASCAICLSDFEEGEALRVLPCRHLFRKECIDEWLAQHSTCPNCRASLLTVPATPAPSAPDPPDGLHFLFGRRGPNSPSGTQVAPTNDVETNTHGQSTNGEFVRVRGPPTDVEMAVREPEEDRRRVG